MPDKPTWMMLGLEKETCPYCGAHLKLVGKPSYEGGTGQPICLNACHLGKAGQKRFQENMKQVFEGLLPDGTPHDGSDIDERK